jgi:RNase P/RNase MRP subunit POP5
VQSAPAIDDPRELQTILVSSLRGLFGDLETHSGRVRVGREEGGPGDPDGERRPPAKRGEGGPVLLVRCPIGSVPFVRAALAMATPPPYLDDRPYRIDVLRVVASAAAPASAAAAES